METVGVRSRSWNSFLAIPQGSVRFLILIVVAISFPAGPSCNRAEWLRGVPDRYPVRPAFFCDAVRFEENDPGTTEQHIETAGPLTAGTKRGDSSRRKQRAFGYSSLGRVKPQPQAENVPGSGLAQRELLLSPAANHALDCSQTLHSSDPFNDIIQEVENAMKILHGEEDPQMDVRRCRCLVKMFPEVIINGELDLDGRHVSVLNLILRPQFILTFEVVKAVTSMPEFWLLVRELVEKSQPAHLMKIMNDRSTLPPLHIASHYRQYHLAQAMLALGAQPWPKFSQFSPFTNYTAVDATYPLSFMLRNTDNLVTLFSRFMIDSSPYETATLRHNVYKMYPVDDWIAISPTAAKLFAKRRETTFAFASQREIRRALHEWSNAFIDLYTKHESPRAGHVNSIIHRVASFADVGGLTTLLKHGGDAAFPDDKRRTALHVMACRGYEGDTEAAEKADKFLSLDSSRGLMDLPDLYGRSPRRLFSVTEAKRSRIRTFTSEQSPGVSANHGGWNTHREASELDIDYCDIAQLDGRNISGETFIREYLVEGRPVIMRGAALDWKFRRTWTKNKLRKLSTEVEVGQIPYEEHFGGQKKIINLQGYIDYLDHASEANITEPEYVFNSKLYHKMDSSNAFWESIPDIPSFLEMEHESLLEQERQLKSQVWDKGFFYQFYLGPAYSGAPFHFHNDAWNALAFGKKRWFLTPPRHSIFSAESPASFLKHRINDFPGSNHMLHCVQNAGDVMYVPSSWGHMILNLKESIGVAGEFRAGGGVGGA